MPKKTPAKNGSTAKVTFEVPKEVDADVINLVGDFNDWSQEAVPLTRRKDGRFSGTLTLETGREYRYRLLLDGERWENDPDADAYVPNDFGSEDSVLRI